MAFFGHVGWDVTDQLALTAGIRYTDEHKDYNFVRLTRDGAVHPFLGALNGLTSEYDGDNIDYRLAVQYDWTDDVHDLPAVRHGLQGRRRQPASLRAGPGAALRSGERSTTSRLA